MIEEKRHEISLKELLLKFRECYRFLLSKKILIVIVGATGGMLGVLYAAFIAKAEYRADLTFVLSSNAPTNGLAGIAGQFGINLGGDNDDMFQGDNIIELLKSKRIVKGALFKHMPATNQPLINFLLNKTEIQKAWLKEERLAGLIPFPDNLGKLTPMQDSLVNNIYKLVTEKYLDIDKVDSKLSFYKVSTTTNFDTLSCFISKYLVEEASDFYIATKTKVARENLNMLQHEADSLQRILSGTIISTGTETDKTFNLNPAYQVQRSSAQKSQLNTTIVGTAYGEVVKNLEIAKITLQKETPLYQKIDEPSLPLEREKLGKIKAGILWGMFFGFTTCFILLAKLVWRKLKLK